MVAEREQDKGANGFTVYSLARGLLSRPHSRKSGCFTDKADTLALCLPYFTGKLAVKSCRDLATLNSVNKPVVLESCLFINYLS